MKKLDFRIPPGMRIFTAVWAGQLVSMIGSALTDFALGVWVFQKTGSAMQFGMILLFTVLPGILIAPIAGALVDRWDRRRTMILADTGSALTTLCVGALLVTGRLEVWHILIAVSFNATFRTFQGPAWTATTSLLVPEEHLGRSAGMMNFARSAAQIVAPLLAGVLVLTIGLGGVILIDFATFAVAVSILFAVRFPAVPRSEEAAANSGSLLREAAYGWKYIAARPSLRSHLFFFAMINLGLGFVWVLFPPLVLSFSNTAALGTVASSVGIGMLVGSMVMTAWGGPQRKVAGILGVGVLLGIGLIVTGIRPWIPMVAFGVFLITFGIPILNGCFMRLWQPRIAPDVQGRAFAAMQVIVWSTEPIAYMTAGFMADRWFTPLLMPGGALENSVGTVLGVGAGRGIGLMLGLAGVFVLTVTAVASLLPHFRGAESFIPIAVNPNQPAEEPAGAAGEGAEAGTPVTA